MRGFWWPHQDSVPVRQICSRSLSLSLSLFFPFFLFFLSLSLYFSRWVSDSSTLIQLGIETTSVRFVTNFANYMIQYKTRCPTLFHTEHHQSSFIGNFQIFRHRNENDDGFVVFCGDLSFHWYIGR